MTGDVKQPRRYRSEHRREQAEQTRQRVLDAAEKLFAERGFESASITAIAAEAGVSPETVYARFHNKRTLLGTLVRQAVRGSDSAPVLEQPGPQAVVTATDQRAQLRLFAADIVLRLERVGSIFAILTGAARADPELTELLARLHTERRANLGRLVDALTANGPLRVAPDDALETVFALASPDLHHLLTQVRGWTRDRYRDWLADSLGAILLEGPWQA